MIGIRSIGWWIPEGRRSVSEIARDYDLSEEAIEKIGLKSHTVAGPDDHPSSMGARATLAALEAAGIDNDQLDLLIYAGITKDYPAPWVGAFGVLHEMGNRNASGFDISSRCAGGIDALWIARSLIESKSYKTIAVCCSERYDYLLGPHRKPELVTDAVFSAGAATVIVTADTLNDMTAFSQFRNPHLGTHAAAGPPSGGSRKPITVNCLQAGKQLWQSQLSTFEAGQVASYTGQADKHNFSSLKEKTGIEKIDFIASSPLNHVAQLAAFNELGISPDSTLFTVESLGHIGAADCFLSLGIAIAVGRSVGKNIFMSTRSITNSNAIAIQSVGNDLGISVQGSGVELSLWL